MNRNFVTITSMIRFGSTSRAAILQSRLRRSTIKNSLYVPSDGFGGASPERKAGVALKKLFTFCAARAVMAQLEGSGRGRLGSYNPKGFAALDDCITDLSKMEPTAWLRKLAEKDPMIAIRVMEVRSSYCAEDFEWENCKRVTLAEMEKDNLQLMRDIVETNATFEEA